MTTIEALAPPDVAINLLPPISSLEQVERFIGNKPATHGTYDGTLADKPDGVYISPDVVASLDHEALPELIKLEPLPGAQLGAGDSHHGVMMGEALLDVNGTHSMARIAIKPFTALSEMAGKEHDALLAARHLGFDTYRPLAVAKDGDTSYLITEWRDGVQSLDAEDWDISPSDVERYETIVKPNLAFIAQSLASMHVKGLFQGDAQIKNFARTKEGSLVVGDLEDAKVSSDIDESAQLIQGGEDMWHLWYAAIHPLNFDATSKSMFLDGESTDVCMQEFEHFLDMYLGALQARMGENLASLVDLPALRGQLWNRVLTTT